MSDRSLAQTIEYEHNAAAETSTANNFKSEDHLTTAFGLAALMQTGFPTTGTILNTQALPKTSTNITSTVVTSTGNNPSNNSAGNNNNGNANEHRWSGSSEEIMSWQAESKLNAFNGAQKASKLTKNRDSDLYQASSANHNNNQSNNSRKNKSASSNHNPPVNSNQLQIQKRYSCSHCPYSTDRRDLYTRHENIHKDEKPFQCYACLKQFNRADHVKKHFLRMHRELPYDINKTRRSMNGDQKPNIFAQNTANNNQQQQTQQQIADSFINAQRNTNAQESSSLSIAQTIESVATAQIPQHAIQMKLEKSSDDKSAVKVKREKRFSCCYCPWSGADKWGLKRHLNTHTKPFVCMLCDYKAARSERLATHVLKVHNKKACNKCSFLADNQEEYQTHMNDIHQLKMDAISRNTASVAQDFHNAGGVTFKVNTASVSTKSTDQLLNKENNNSMEQQNENDSKVHQRKAMSSKHKNASKQLNKSSPPAYINATKSHTSKGHRLDLTQDKENYNSIFSNMEYENNLKQLELQFQNYVKEIISKYYAETPLLYASTTGGMSPSAMSTETKNYIEYLKNKSDITLTIAPRNCESTLFPPEGPEMNLALPSAEKRNRKQAQPKKISKHELLLNRLRDKYLKKLVDRRKSCVKCANNIRNYMVFFPYHSPGSLAFHRLWKHTPRTSSCPACHKQFQHSYSLKVHQKIKHRRGSP